MSGDSRLNFSDLFIYPDEVSLLTDHGKKFATDKYVIWDVDRLPTVIRSHFEVIFEDSRVTEGMAQEVRVTSNRVCLGRGVPTDNPNQHYEAWLEFIEQYDQVELQVSRVGYADPAGTPLALLYSPLGSEGGYLGAMPRKLLDASRKALRGLRAFYCNDSRDIVMLAQSVPREESLEHRHLIRYEGENGRADLLRPAAFLHMPAQQGLGVVPGSLFDFIKANQHELWAFSRLPG
jgi:hypothetical protein